MRPIAVHLDRVPIVFQITAVVSLLLVLVLAACLFTVSIVLTDSIRGNAGGHMESIAIDLADRLDDGMLERYQDVVGLTSSDPFTLFEQGRGKEAQAWIDGLQDSYRHYAWIGLAGRDGAVLAASDGVLKGTSVAERPWFAAGSVKAHLGDVHEAVLLANLLSRADRGPDAEPLHLIDMAAPVKDPAGNLVGVLARISQTTGMPSPGEFFCAWLGLSFRATACLAASGHAQRSASGGSTGHRCSSVVDGMGERRRLHRGGG